MVIIECDDWGSINMPTKDIYGQLLSAGLPVDKRSWNKYDTLETRNDLELLFDVLSSVKDRNSRPAIITPVINMANPDFQKIRSGGFVKYHYEKFTDTYNNYYPDSNVFELWKQGLEYGIFTPELHGREHIAVQLWMDKLREGNKDLLYAFDHGFVSLEIPDIFSPAKEFRAEFFFASQEQKPFLTDSINDGVRLFKEIFGFPPRVFVPANGIFHSDFDAVVASAGIKFLNVSYLMPYPDLSGGLKYRYFVTGQKNLQGLTYYTRNCAFEPTDESYKGIDLTLRQVAAAFRWGKPANISTHRANFAGGLDPTNRAKGLSELKKLLEEIIKLWPDAEFMGSGDALEYMRNSN